MVDIRRRNGKVKEGNWRRRKSMRDCGLRKETEDFRGEGVRVWAGQVMGIKKVMDCMKYWVF